METTLALKRKFVRRKVKNLTCVANEEARELALKCEQEQNQPGPENREEARFLVYKILALYWMAWLTILWRCASYSEVIVFAQLYYVGSTYLPSFKSCSEWRQGTNIFWTSSLSRVVSLRFKIYTGCMIFTNGNVSQNTACPTKELLKAFCPLTTSCNDVSVSWTVRSSLKETWLSIFLLRI